MSSATKPAGASQRERERLHGVAIDYVDKQIAVMNCVVMASDRLLAIQAVLSALLELRQWDDA